MPIHYNRESLVALRREIHQFPELSGAEAQTAARVVNFISQYKPEKVYRNLGGHGVAFVFEGEKPGKTVGLRCELDALPIAEVNEFEYRSQHPRIGHKCGHDGHIAILAGVAQALSHTRTRSGRVFLLFQPAEETGQGAARVVSDPQFALLKPDMMFALHNLPGFEKHQIVVSNGIFSSASKGIIFKLKGKTSHAGEPERGVNPAKAVSLILQDLLSIEERGHFQSFVLATVVHVALGEIAFGTSAGYAEVRATLRAYQNEDMTLMTKELKDAAVQIANEEHLDLEIDFAEAFPATPNNEQCTQIVRQAAQTNGFQTCELEKPFRWSEDFSHFALQVPSALFGLGAGTEHAQLHNPDYDFPEEIIDTGVQTFTAICHQILS